MSHPIKITKLDPAKCSEFHVDAKVRLNTGHHYFPVKKDIKALFPSLPEDDLGSDAGNKWHSSLRYPWLRVQIIKTKIGTTGYEHRLLVCIDSNTGGVQRGNVFGPVGDDSGAGRFHYVHSDENVHERAQAYSVEISNNINLNIRISWVNEAVDARDVDLLVDFGNSRTAAALLETKTAEPGFAIGGLRNALFSVRFAARDRQGWEEAGLETGENGVIVESWFMLRETHFAGLRFDNDGPGTRDYLKSQFGDVWRISDDIHLFQSDGKNYLIPQLFVEMAPTLFGEFTEERMDDFATDEKAKASLETRPAFMSSPKRYSWDDFERGNENWHMGINVWNKEADSLPTKLLEGNVLRFITTKGAKPTTPWPSQPIRASYARKVMLVFMALNTIETAFRKMNSRGRDGIKRHMRAVRVTYPTGWTFGEKKSYQECWAMAVNIFAQNHLQQDVVPPVLNWDIDEAVAAQLPVVYDSLVKMQGSADKWLGLFGKPVQVASAGHAQVKPAVRVMSIDIGGGTTDCAVVEYKKAGNREMLEYSLVFQDSSNSAGDRILQILIEKYLLPGVRDNFFNGDNLKIKFNDYWLGNTGDTRHRRTYYARRVFIPLAGEILSRLDRDDSNPTDNFASKIAVPAAKALMDMISVISGDESHTSTPLSGTEKQKETESMITTIMAGILAKKKDINNEIREAVETALKDIPRRVVKHDVDLLVLSGKPSELECIQQLVQEHAPLSRNRILQTKGRRVNEWYPFAKNGKIADAKTVNLVGLAVGALGEKLTGGIAIKRAVGQGNMQDNEWVVRDRNRALGDGNILLNFSGPDGTAQCEIAHEWRICRRPKGGRLPTAVYMFWVNVDDPDLRQARISLTLARDKDGQLVPKIATIPHDNGWEVDYTDPVNEKRIRYDVEVREEIFGRMKAYFAPVFPDARDGNGRGTGYFFQKSDRAANVSLRKKIPAAAALREFQKGVEQLEETCSDNDVLAAAERFPSPRKLPDCYRIGPGNSLTILYGVRGKTNDSLVSARDALCALK